MHELGIAAAILECVQKEAERHPDGRITKVGVKIGELSGVDATRSVWLRSDGEGHRVGAAGAGPGVCSARATLPEVRYEFRMGDYDPRCPLCGEFTTECISGEELDIAYMEVDE